MYKVITPSGFESSIWSLSDCFDVIAIQMIGFSSGKHQITTKKAYDAGYRIVKA